VVNTTKVNLESAKKKKVKGKSKKKKREEKKKQPEFRERRILENKANTDLKPYSVF